MMPTVSRENLGALEVSMSFDDNSPFRETSGERPRRSGSVANDDLGPLSDEYGYTPKPTPTASYTQADGVVPAEVAPPKPKRQGLGAVREIIETLLLAFVIFVAVRAVVLNFKVDGTSMVPNLHNQEMLLVNRNIYFHFDLNGVLDDLPFIERDGERIVYPFHPPERGDIIVFDPPTLADKPYIKRVIGLPGETITIADGFVYVDGVKLNEPYIDGAITECNRSKCDPVKVPEGSVFVLGDNRRSSSDSRIFGPVSVDDIIGKAWITYWPFSDFGMVPHYDYPEIRD
jgi:signal peptidase I